VGIGQPGWIDAGVGGCGSRQKARAVVNNIVRMNLVEPVLYGVVKIAWMDGYEAVVDLRPVISEGETFEFLRRSPDRFDQVKLSEFGHSIYWLDDEGDEIDFGAGSLRSRAERQAAILRLAS
jgi:Protein of unknown function (DUF2442)